MENPESIIPLAQKWENYVIFLQNEINNYNLKIQQLEEARNILREDLGLSKIQIEKLSSDIINYQKEIAELKKIIEDLKNPAPIPIPEFIGLKITASATLYNGGPTFEVYSDDLKVGEFTVNTSLPEKEVISLPGDFSKTSKIKIRFINDLWDGGTQDRNLYIYDLEINDKKYDANGIELIYDWDPNVKRKLTNNEINANGYVTFVLDPTPIILPAPEISNDYFSLIHHMILMGRYNSKPTEDELIIIFNELKSYGLTASVIYWDDFIVAKPQYELALSAATKANFKIVIGFLGFQSQHLKDFIVANKNHPALLKDKNGKIVISGYFNCWDLDQGNLWRYKDNGHLRFFKDKGVEIAYYPDFPYCPIQSKGNRANQMGINGIFEFFPTPQTLLGGGVYNYTHMLDWMENQYKDCQLNNIEYMPPIIPYYAAQPSHNYMMYESYGFVGLKKTLQWIINKKIKRVQIVTANDYNEKSYLMTFGKGGYLVGDPTNPFWQPTLVLDHSGFGKFIKRYLKWIETGIEPQIIKDEFLIAYRLHPKNVKSYKNLTDGEKTILKQYIPIKTSETSGGEYWANNEVQKLGTHDIMMDSVQLCVRLKEPATVTLICGQSITKQDLLAGEHILEIKGSDSGQIFNPSQFGKPQIKIERNGSIIKVGEGGLPISQYILPGNFNYLSHEI